VPREPISAPPGKAALAPFSEGPVAIISRRAADRLRAGHVWVYRSDIEHLVEMEAGLLAVADHRGFPLGTALWSPSSQIALRLLTTDPHLTDLAWMALFELPGLIVDRYGDLILFEILAKALDRDDIRAAIVHVLKSELAPLTIVERSDARIRELEQLSEPAEPPLYSAEPIAQLTTIFHLNGLAFHYNANAGQKTGAFLDQRLNYAAAARHARGEALDVCTYQGGFALHLARTCTRVTGIDASRAALEVAEENLEVNRHRIEASVEWIEANAFDLLRDWSTAGTTFDTVVLDPPAFAKSKRAVPGALRGYKELNLRALKMLRPGGTLVTCSCSHHVSWDEFHGVVADAAGDAQRRVRLLERREAAPDHPVVLNIPETEYLKCLILQVD
jgi:23S rRNA (cytosine1962-C5)-methyltransferase